jgi:hypothetical protein
VESSKLSNYSTNMYWSCPCTVDPSPWLPLYKCWFTLAVFIWSHLRAAHQVLMWYSGKNVRIPGVFFVGGWVRSFSTLQINLSSTLLRTTCDDQLFLIFMSSYDFQ